MAFDTVEHPIEARRLIGYLPENAPAYTDMTVLGFLNFCAEIRGLRGAARKDAVERVVEMCFLQAVLHQSVETLSKGYRHRTCFAQSIIHDPEVLVLDEPTDGLDPEPKTRGAPARSGGWARRKPLFFRRTFSKKSMRFVPGRSSSIAGASWPTARPGNCGRNPSGPGRSPLRLGGARNGEVKDKLSQLVLAKKVVVLEENASGVLARIYPKQASGELAWTVANLSQAEKLDLEELHTEEGRLDEVFRTITMPDTADGE